MDLDIDLSYLLDKKMQSLTMNDILYQQQSYEEDILIDTKEINTEEIDNTDNIISDMQNLTINETNNLIIDLFENNLDIYSIYNDIKIKSLDPTEFNTKNEYNEYNKFNKYNILRVLGVPNIYCNGEDFDDEDFIYNRFKLSEHLSYLVQNDNTIPELDANIINFGDTTISPENVYYKTLYIYQFVHYFNTSLNTINPYKKRITHLPQEFLVWIENIVSIIRNSIDITNMKTILCVYQNTNHAIIKNVEQYFKDLIYGLNLCVCHIKMILNHHRIRQIHFWDMEDKCIEKLFRILNNLCIIVIYMKHGF
jgi:hypothetical protein